MSQINILRSPYRQDANLGLGVGVKRKFQHTVVEKVVRFDLNPLVVMIILLGMSILLSVVYLAQFNKVATKGYELKKLELTRQDLNSQKQQKEMYLARARAMTAIIESNRVDRMRKPKDMNFVYEGGVIAKLN